MKTRIILIKINSIFKYFNKNIVNKLLTKHIIVFLFFTILLFFNTFNSLALASDNQKIAIYTFSNLTGNDDWTWLERAFPDLLSHTFSQLDKVNNIPFEKIAGLENSELFQGLAEKKDLNLFRSLNDLLKADLIFTGYFSTEERGLLTFNLSMYQARIDQLFEFREMTITPEDIFFLKEEIATTILNEANVLLDDKIMSVLKKNITTSRIALEYYYQSMELKNQAILEYKGIDFPSKPLWSKAIDYGEKAVSEDPFFAEAYYLLSQIYERTKWTYLEITNLEKYIDTAKNNTNINISFQKLSDALFRLAYSEYSKENIASSIEYLEDSIFYLSSNIKARELLMKTYYETGQISKALEQAEEIKKYEPENGDIEWFFKQYQQAEIHGKEAYELYVTGYRAYSNKKWQEAIKLLSQSIKVNEDFKEAHYFLGLSYYQYGDLENSIKYLEDTIRLDPFDNNARIYLNKAIEEREFGREAVWIFNQGYKHYVYGEYEDALIKFKESAQKNPNYEKTRIFLMRTYFHLNQMDDYLKEREKIGGNSLFSIDWEKEYYQLSYNYYSLGDYNAALDRLKEVLDVNPDYLEARFLIAETLYQLGKYNESNQHYKYIINNYLDSEYYQNALLGSGWCSYLLEDYSDAEIVLELLVKNYPRSTLYLEGVYKLGRVYFKQKKFPNAINLYEELLILDISDFDEFEIKFILGQSYFWEEIFDKAKMYFNDIIKNKPGFELINETKYYYSFVLYKEGNYQEARNILEELLTKKNEIQDDALYLLARVLLEQKEYDKVIEINNVLASSIKDNRILERVLFDLGLAYSRKGEDGEAISYFERIVKQFPEGELFSIATIELAQSYYDLGQYKDVLVVLGDLDSKDVLELKLDAAAKLSSDEEDMLSIYQEISDKYQDDSLLREAYFVQAKSKYEKGEFQGAIDIFQNIENMTITEKMKQEIYYWQGLSYYRLGDHLQAEEYFKRIDYLSSDEEIAIRALYMLGETCYKEEKYFEAIDYYQKFLEHHGSHSLAPHVQYSISWSYFNLNEFSKSIESLLELIKKYPDSQFVEESNFLVGKIHFLNKNNNNSKDALLNFLKIYPDSTFMEEAVYIFAQINLEEENWIESILYFEKLIEYFPKSQYSSGSLYGLCLSYFKKEEYEKSLQVGDRYLVEYYNGTFACDILYINAICEEELGNNFKAAEKYKALLQKCPETIFADNARKRLEQINLE